MSIHILVVEMPQIVPFPVYGQTGNGIILGILTTKMSMDIKTKVDP